MHYIGQKVMYLLHWQIRPQDLSEADLELLWEAIINMFENDHSAARGKECMRKLYVFKHSNVIWK